MNVPPVTHISYLMFVLAGMLLGPTIFFIVRARRGKLPTIRRIPGIDAIDEGIGRATELGRPIVFTTGLTGLSPLLYAILGILKHIGRLAARMGTRIIVPQNDYEVMPIVEGVLREAHRDEGKLEQFNPEDIRFLSTTQFAFASGYMGIVHREQAATCFLFGNFAAESLILAEAGQQVGAMQVAGTINSEQVPYFITSCDYTLIGEEVYAAGAYLSQDPNQLGGLRGQDVAKMGALATIVLGLALGLGFTLARGDSTEGVRYNSPFTNVLYAKPSPRRCIARFEAGIPFRASVPPEWDELNPDPADVADDLAEASAGAAVSLWRLASALRAQEEWLAASREAITSDAGRRAVDDLQTYLAEAAATAEKERDEFERLRSSYAGFEERLGAVEAASFKARWTARAGGIAAWAGEYGTDRERASAAAAAAALGALSAGASDDQLDAAVESVRAAFEDACDKYVDIMSERKAKFDEMADADTYPAGRGPLRFDASSSVDGDGDRLVYGWGFGDEAEEGDPERTPAPSASHAYEKNGTYRVTLLVSDKRESETVQAAPPPAKDSAIWRRETAAGTELKLSWPMPADADAETASVTWDFGDGATAEGLTASHTYEEAGWYAMTARATYDVVESSEAAAGARAGAAVEVEDALQDVRDDLADAMKLIEKRVERVQARNGKLVGLLGGARGMLPDGVDGSEELVAWLDGEAERGGKIAAWLDELTSRVAKLRATSEAFGAAPVEDEEAAAEGEGAEARRTKVEKRSKVVWTVEEEHTHTVTKSVTVEDAADDVPAPWSYKPEKDAAAEGGGE